MISYDRENDQLLTPCCINCPDPYFQTQHHDLFHVGCCSYSPVFTLFEMAKMIRAERVDFFMERIYRNENNRIGPYEIEVHADVHPLFQKHDRAGLTQVEREDLQQDFSVCQFFVPGKGCGLNPRFKTSVCRAFICTTVEERLAPEDKAMLDERTQAIYREAEAFNQKHETALKNKGWNLIDHLPQVLQYLATAE